MRAACLALALVSVLRPAAADPLYRLPWQEGLTLMFTQAPGGRITSHVAKAHLHAVDIAMPEGTPVLAARAGVVESLEDRHGASRDEAPATYEGNFVRVRHADGSAATYAHLKHAGVVVQVGEAVAAGRLLGYSGRSGDISVAQLHFGITRMERNASGWPEERSLPITFYVGDPPITFQPRAALMAKADYSAHAERPRTPAENVLRARAPPAQGEEGLGWAVLYAWIACGLVGLAVYAAFSRHP
jgi:murein DD-endopeptidase MepM/ murein hydrolase activator NlpD